MHLVYLHDDVDDLEGSRESDMSRTEKHRCQDTTTLLA